MTLNNINNSCGNKGCTITHRVLPNDSRIVVVYMEMFSARDDISKILPVSSVKLDEKLEKRSGEKIKTNS